MNSRRSREIIFPGGTITGTIPYLVREWEGDAASMREVEANGRVLPEKCLHPRWYRKIISMAHKEIYDIQFAADQNCLRQFIWRS
jgi:hypothetical protein